MLPCGATPVDTRVSLPRMVTGGGALRMGIEVVQEG